MKSMQTDFHFAMEEVFLQDQPHQPVRTKREKELLAEAQRIFAATRLQYVQYQCLRWPCHTHPIDAFIHLEHQQTHMTHMIYSMILVFLSKGSIGFSVN